LEDAARKEEERKVRQELGISEHVPRSPASTASDLGSKDAEDAPVIRLPMKRGHHASTDQESADALRFGSTTIRLPRKSAGERASKADLLAAASAKLEAGNLRHTGDVARLSSGSVKWSVINKLPENKQGLIALRMQLEHTRALLAAVEYREMLKVSLVQSGTVGFCEELASLLRASGAMEDEIHSAFAKEDLDMRHRVRVKPPRRVLRRIRSLASPWQKEDPSSESVGSPSIQKPHDQVQPFLSSASALQAGFERMLGSEFRFSDSCIIQQERARVDDPLNATLFVGPEAIVQRIGEKAATLDSSQTKQDASALQTESNMEHDDHSGSDSDDSSAEGSAFHSVGSLSSSNSKPSTFGPCDGNVDLTCAVAELHGPIRDTEDALVRHQSTERDIDLGHPFEWDTHSNARSQGALRVDKHVQQSGFDPSDFRTWSRDGSVRAALNRLPTWI